MLVASSFAREDVSVSSVLSRLLVLLVLSLASCDSTVDLFAVRGRVVDAVSEKPIADAAITITDEAAEQVLAEARTADSGRFAIDVAEPASAAAVVVRIEAERYVARTLPLSAFGEVEVEVRLERARMTADEIGLDFVFISAGSFEMGSTSGAPDEQPVHTVAISKGFYLGRFEVTQGQWDAVMWTNPSLFATCGVACPVESVSWDDAQEFLAKLNAAEGAERFRLPTEAEWEYAARAGSTTEYSFGDDPAQLPDYAWYGENASAQAHPVGQKLPNPWGLYDMHGNVWEWVADRYGAETYETSSAVDPAGPPTGDQRVRRGGGWSGGPAELRAAARSSLYPTSRYGVLGFRVLKTAE